MGEVIMYHIREYTLFTIMGGWARLQVEIISVRNENEYRRLD